MYNTLRSLVACLLICSLFFAACNNAEKPVEKDIVKTPEELDKQTSSNIKTAFEYAADHQGDIGDSVVLLRASLLKDLYSKQEYKPIWSTNGKWHAGGDSLVSFIQHAQYYGLFPSDYHGDLVSSVIGRFAKDTSGKTDQLDAALWSRVDVAMSDAFLQMVKDIHLGRLPNDSVSLRKDSLMSDERILALFEQLKNGSSITSLVQPLEPAHEGYQLLKQALPAFLAKSGTGQQTHVPSLKEDPANYSVLLQKRLTEGGYLEVDTVAADSVKISKAVKKFQEELGITADGKAGAGTLRMLNMSDKDRFKSIAITMDRYKLLPEQMPERYIWVNLPAYHMELREGDTIKLESKVICGKPLTRTPLLTSAISNIITYPQWTIPTSIIVKEILPGLKRSPDYLAKKGFSLIDGNGDEVDPHSVDWTKYSKGIPYKVVQGSGDDNALGVLKFNFPNKYAVYLHDTNQRYLFGQAVRCLSHGCVRVQAWRELAHQIISYDNQDREREDELGKVIRSPTEDSMVVWLDRKEKHSINIRKRLPVFIRYFTCEAKDGKLVFYDDMYGEDKAIAARYFVKK